MTALIAAETLVLLLLLLLVAGLLRSHAEILRRVGGEDPTRGADNGLARSNSELTLERGGSPTPDAAVVLARPIEGTPVLGGPGSFELAAGEPNTLLAFLSSGCTSCGAFWDAFSSRRRQPLVRGVRLIIVAQGEEFDSPSRLKKIAPKRVPVVMSTSAWKDYGVVGSPYFVYVDGESGEVRGEGAAMEWDQLARLISDALADAELADDGVPAGRDPRLSDSHPARIREADRALLAAGIGPDHPSLWPGGKPTDSEQG